MREEKFLDSANTRQTSPEILEIIFEIANEKESLAATIWEIPTQEQVDYIAWRLANSGLVPTEHYWGASGNQWARS